MKGKNARAWTLSAGLLVASVLLGGCGQDDDNDEEMPPAAATTVGDLAVSQIQTQTCEQKRAQEINDLQIVDTQAAVDRPARGAEAPACPTCVARSNRAAQGGAGRLGPASGRAGCGADRCGAPQHPGQLIQPVLEAEADVQQQHRHSQGRGERGAAEERKPASRPQAAGGGENQQRERTDRQAQQGLVNAVRVQDHARPGNRGDPGAGE